jgi:uncharacterized protein YwgA
MNRLKNSVVLSYLVEQLRENGSWCGETHIQKACYILQELLEIPFNYSFILYKHGPFSFELRDELTALRADGLLKLEFQNPPYGARVATTEMSDKLQHLFPRTWKKYKTRVDFVASAIQNKGVAELERLSTALYITRKYKIPSIEDRAQKLVSLKPHVTTDKAIDAIREIDRLAEEVKIKITE